MAAGKSLAGATTTELVENVALRKCLEHIDICMLKIVSLMISGVKVKPLGWIRCCLRD